MFVCVFDVLVCMLDVWFGMLLIVDEVICDVLVCV